VKKIHSKEVVAFLTTLMACGAFLVGSVKIWGVQAEKLWSGLLMVLLMVASVAVLAFLFVFTLKKIRQYFDR
jgi:hypothetical protein